MNNVCRKQLKKPHLLKSMCLIALLVGGAFSLELKAQQKVKTNDLTDNCEMVSAKLDLVMNAFDGAKSDGSYLIIIGKSPRNISSSYARRQIDDALKYFDRFFKIDKNKTARGFDKTSNKVNQLQFFVGGKLITEIYFNPKGKGLCDSDGLPF